MKDALYGTQLVLFKFYHVMRLHFLPVCKPVYELYLLHVRMHIFGQ